MPKLPERDKPLERGHGDPPPAAPPEPTSGTNPATENAPPDPVERGHGDPA